MNTMLSCGLVLDWMISSPNQMLFGLLLLYYFQHDKNNIMVQRRTLPFRLQTIKAMILTARHNSRYFILWNVDRLGKENHRRVY